MWLDSLQEILYSLKQNRLRTVLTGFGVFWGIFMLVLLLGAGQGLKRGVEASFSSDVRDAIWISSRKTSVPYRGLALDRWIAFKEADLYSLRQQLTAADIVAAEQPLGSIYRGDIYITRNEKSGNFSVFGVSDGYFEIKKFQEYRQGRRLNSLDDGEQRKVVVIGTKVAEALFNADENPIGQQIAVNGVSLMVVGVFYDSGWEGRMSERLYMPLSTYQKTFGKENRIGILALTPKPGADAEQLIADALRILKERHQIAPSDRNALQVTNLAEQSQQVTATFIAINTFLWLVGIGTLTAGIVGISNIMIISVKERAREIGVRKALGATPLQITRTIVAESLLVTVIAGYLGLVLSVALLELYNHLANQWQLSVPYFQQPEVDLAIATMALAILVVVGAFAGLIPAWQAARIAPIEAMRSE